MKNKLKNDDASLWYKENEVDAFFCPCFPGFNTTERHYTFQHFSILK
jgi:hypothetical protein